MEKKERAKASPRATKHFLRLLRALRARGGGTHVAFTDGSKVGADHSRDGAPHTACGVWEGPWLVSGVPGLVDDDEVDDEVPGLMDDNEIELGLLVPPNAYRAYGCALPEDAEVPDAELVANELLTPQLANFGIRF